MVVAGRSVRRETWFSLPFQMVMNWWLLVMSFSRNLGRDPPCSAKMLMVKTR